MKLIKTLAIAAIMLNSISFLCAKPYVPKQGQLQFKVLQTTANKPLREIQTTPFTQHGYSLLKSIDLDAATPSHDYLGIGVSMTDASCWLLWQMSPDARHSLLKSAFSSRGMNLSIVRLNCGSSDYATELYNYNDTRDDMEMKHFSVARDEEYMIPIISQLYTYCPDLYLFASVWSMPGWMKNSDAMCGGSLLDKYMPAFAKYWASYLKAYKQHGLVIDAITVQNEPSTDQRGGCPATLVSAKQEIELAGKYLPKEFKAAGLKTKIWVWDHDYSGWERVNQVLGEARVRSAVDAVAWHPYSGTPDMMQEVRRRNPNLPMHLTERGPNLTMKQEQNPKWWADVVFGALNNGCSSFSSWNLLLDEDGQPNTGRFPCGGLLSINTDTGKITESTQALLFKQFSPYVLRGAKIMAIEQPEKDITAITFRNPDGQYVIVVAADNKPRSRQRVQIKYKGLYLALCLPLDTWSLTTLIIDRQ